MQVEILHNQSLLDVAFQSVGMAEGIIVIAAANGISITDDLQAGTFLQIPDVVEIDTDIRQYFAVKGVKPATAITTTIGAAARLEGVDYWAISNNFIVS